MLSAGGALLFTFLLLLVWLLRLVCGLYRWHPAVREVLFLLVAGLLFCWEFRGFTPIIWYKLDVSCCSGVGTTPTWHVSPLQRAYMSVFDDWSAGRFGHRLVANDEEFHQNYFPRVGHGPCWISFSSYAGITKPVGDAFVLDLPQDDARNMRLSLADDSEALGEIWRRTLLPPYCPHRGRVKLPAPFAGRRWRMGIITCRWCVRGVNFAWGPPRFALRPPESAIEVLLRRGNFAAALREKFPQRGCGR